MWVKICGLTDPDEVYQISRMGVDAIGFVFYPKSPRAVTLAQATSLARRVHPSVLKVGVFVDPDWELIREAALSVPLDLIQWHGKRLNASEIEHLASIGTPWIDVFKIQAGDPPAVVVPSSGASMVLVEGFSEKSPGGTRTKWDYSLLSDLTTPVPLVLSGGLDPITVKKAIQAVSPYGVDVSSGVEKSPGRKDFELVARFLKESGK